jgi:uncharacterized SAM-binding protein YcdF (DUF218 family)
MLARIAGRLGLAALLFGVLSGYFLFDSFHEPSIGAIAGAEASVVFTGAHERIDAGLQLVAAKATPRLFISGANSEAGIFPGRFVPDFSARNPNIDLNRLLACCVELGEAANSTFENAWETRAWLRRRHIAGPVALITSRLHMPRALMLLSGAIWPQRIIPYPVEDEFPSTDPLRERALEYLKYLASPAMALAPRFFK